MPTPETVRYLDVVTGTLLVDSFEAFVLFDSGATYSFVSLEFTSQGWFEFAAYFPVCCSLLSWGLIFCFTVWSHITGGSTMGPSMIWCRITDSSL